MVHFQAISIILLPIVTVLGSQFWNDVDTLFNELLDPHDMTVEPTPGVPHHSPFQKGTEEDQITPQSHLKKRTFRNNITVHAEEVRSFNQTFIVDKSYPENASLAAMQTKLLASGTFQEWSDLLTHPVHKNLKYWGKVCVSFWGKPLVDRQRFSCTLSTSWAVNKKRTLQIQENKVYFDLLFCKCFPYETNYRFPTSDAEIFLIHKNRENEFYIFEQNSTRDNRYNLCIKHFEGGITLPKPLEKQSQTKNLEYLEKFVTLGADEIEPFTQAVTIDESYPKNMSFADLEPKLLQFEDNNEWPNLYIYHNSHYSKYWAKVCVFFWDAHLLKEHRQLCIVSPSFGYSKRRKLFIGNKTLHFDLLYCKCHSYTSNYRYPVTSTDTFLIHQWSENEFFVFEQQTTQHCHFTLFIKNFKGGVTLPDPGDFK